MSCQTLLIIIYLTKVVEIIVNDHCYFDTIVFSQQYGTMLTDRAVAYLNVDIAVQGVYKLLLLSHKY